ncbi:class I SAM-dependent methyltransferase [Massilia sp. S19_KUP03_FR1]|uniref:class I SAM-dependent methyltransferase n=1 Tax=Massilia sp. S19_KUP03_FR1 TaxID=3025503 RepID=UPI002FCDD8EE
MTLILRDRDALFALGRALEAAHYRFTTITPASHARINARPGNAQALDLRGVFGWSRPFSPDAFDPAIVELMRRAGVLDASGPLLRSSVRAATLGERCYFHSAWPTEHGDSVFFGPDTYRFVAAIERALRQLAAPPARVVDIGCGAGPGAVQIARRFPDAEVFGADINPASLALTSINAGLAGARNVTPVASNLLDGMDGEFDLIVSNPPFMLDPGQRTYRNGGGPRGAALSVEIVKAAMARLRPGGSLLLYTGVAISADQDDFQGAIAPLLDTACQAWTYEELDPDVFGEELATPAYAGVERIAAVWLHAVKRTRMRKSDL